jgi:Tol biopolymer transport system component
LADPFDFRLSDISPSNSELLVIDRSNWATGDQQAWTVPLPSGSRRRLGNIQAHDATWSPDGKQIAFAKGSNILLADADGTNPRQLISVAGSPSMMRFSPDGTRIRFSLDSPDDTANSIWEVRSDGKDLHPLMPGWHNPAQECCGIWTPDGRYYLFTSGDANNIQVYALRESRGLFRKSSTPYQLTSGPMFFLFGVPTPDGKRFLVDGTLPRYELVRYDDHVHGFVPFLSGISADHVDFSRDGKWVVYISVPDETLWRSRIDGSERLQLTFPPTLPFLPHWSPDGTQIIYSDAQTMPWKNLLISGQGGMPTEMFSEKDYPDAQWSPDGKRIVFGRYPFIAKPPDVFDMRILDIASKQVSAIPGSQNFYAPRWSPDGEHLAGVSTDHKRLAIYDFKTQKWSDWLTNESIGTPAWSRDGRYIYFNTIGEHPEYRRVKLGETHSEFLADLKDLHSASWWSGITPENSPIFCRDIGTDEIYALDLELP